MLEEWRLIAQVLYLGSTHLSSFFLSKMRNNVTFSQSNNSKATFLTLSKAEWISSSAARWLMIVTACKIHRSQLPACMIIYDISVWEREFLEPKNAIWVVSRRHHYLGKVVHFLLQLLHDCLLLKDV